MSDCNDMHKSIVATFESIVAFDNLEASQLGEIFAWLRSTNDIYRREKPSTPARHLAVYCVPVDFAESRIFLGNHLGARRWLPPGGHVDVNEHPRIAAIRECQEELGVAPNLFLNSPILATLEATVGLDIHTDMTLWFAFECSARVPLTLTENEFDGQSWVSFADVNHLNTNPNMGRFLAKLRRMRSQIQTVQPPVRPMAHGQL